MLKPLIKLLPLSPIVSIFGLAKLEFVPNVWLACTAVFIAGVTYLIGRPSHILLWGEILVVTSVLFFVFGALLTWFYRIQGGTVSESGLDRIAGMLLMIALVLPLLIGGFEWMTDFFNTVCRDFLHCGVIIPKIIAFLAVVPVPFLLYYYMLEWSVMPKSWLDRNMMNTTLGAFLDDLFIPFYIAILLNLFLFIPFKLDMPDMIKYYRYTFLKSYITIKEDENVKGVTEKIEQFVPGKDEATE
jgi:hypothetical protein